MTTGLNSNPSRDSAPVTSQVAPVGSDYFLLDPVPYLYALWRGKFLLVALPILCGVISVGLSYTRPKMYSASVHFLPPARSSAGLLFSLGRSGGGDEYRTELASRTVALDVIEHQNLLEYFKLKDPDQVRGMLAGMSQFATDSSNFLTITVTSTDPQLSTRLANEYFSALYRLGEKISAREAEHRLNFMSGPLEVEKERLRVAEDALRDAQQKTGLVSPGTQATLGMQQVATLSSRISELSTQLSSARLGSTEENPRVITLRTQVANLQGQLDHLRSNSSEANSPAQLPQLSLEVNRREREVQFHTNALDALTRSLETVQMSESYTPSLSLIDPAFLPKNKTSPSRSKWLLYGFIFGFVLALLSLMVRAAYRQWVTSPGGMDTLAHWKDSWRRQKSPGPAHAK